MDPITLLATASAIWSGIKKASEFAAEAEGVWGQLSKYCGVADQLEQVIQEEKLRPKKPKLFAKQSAGNDVQEAFNAFEAEHKLMQMEKDIRHEFLYGAFCNLKAASVGWMATPSFATCAARSGPTGLSLNKSNRSLKSSSGTT
jgi:hypothetical protein